VYRSGKNSLPCPLHIILAAIDRFVAVTQVDHHKPLDPDSQVAYRNPSCVNQSHNSAELVTSGRTPGDSGNCGRSLLSCRRKLQTGDTLNFADQEKTARSKARPAA